MTIRTQFVLTCDGFWYRGPGLLALDCPTRLGFTPFATFADDLVDGEFVNPRDELRTEGDMRAEAIAEDRWICGPDGDFCPEHAEQPTRWLHEASGDVLLHFEDGDLQIRPEG